MENRFLKCPYCNCVRASVRVPEKMSQRSVLATARAYPDGMTGADIHYVLE